MGLPVRSLAHGVHLFGRGGPPAGLPCGSQIPTYSSFSVRPFSARGGTSFTMCRPAVRVRGHAGGGGGGGGGSPFGPAPFLLGGGGVGAAKSLLPSFLVPKGNQPTACTLALWWLKFGPTEGSWGGKGTQGCAKCSETRSNLQVRRLKLSVGHWRTAAFPLCIDLWPTHRHLRVSSSVTERYLWSYRPLTSPFSFCALCCLPLVHTCNSPEFLRGGGGDVLEILAGCVSKHYR